MSDDPKRTTPEGLITYSKEFRKAALATDDKLGMEDGYEIVAPVPVMYLVAHSIELSIKAYLLHKGQTLRQLRKVGHDICKALKKAKELGIGQVVEITEIEMGALQVLNDLYSKKELNYIVTGFKKFPMFGPLQELSEKLLQGVADEIGYPKHLLA